MLRMAFLRRSLDARFLGAVKSKMKAPRLLTMARKQNAIIVFRRRAALYVTQLSISKKRINLLVNIFLNTNIVTVCHRN